MCRGRPDANRDTIVEVPFPEPTHVGWIRARRRASAVPRPMDRTSRAGPRGRRVRTAGTPRKSRTVARLLRGIDHPPSRYALWAERAFSVALGGDCRVPLAAYATVRTGRLALRAEVLDAGGEHHWTGRLTGPADSAQDLGRRLARRALEAGVPAWMSRGIGR